MAQSENEIVRNRLQNIFSSKYEYDPVNEDMELEYGLWTYEGEEFHLGFRIYRVEPTNDDFVEVDVHDGPNLLKTSKAVDFTTIDDVIEEIKTIVEQQENKMGLR